MSHERSVTRSSEAEIIHQPNFELTDRVDLLVHEWEEKLDMPAEIDSHSVLPAKLAQRARKAYERFYRDNQASPTNEELLDLMEVTSEKQRRLVGQYLVRADFDTETQLDLDEKPATDDLSDPSEIITNTLLKEHIPAILDSVSSREAAILSMHFGLTGEPMTLDEIAKIYGVSRARIQQIETAVLRKLRHPNHSKALRDYLIESRPKEPSREHASTQSRNPFLRKFTTFEPIEPPQMLSLKQRIFTDEERQRITSRPWMNTQDESKLPPNQWQSVINARRSFGLKELSSAEFDRVHESVKDAILLNDLALRRVQSLPLAQSESSHEQRTKIVEVYESRHSHLQVLLKQFYEFLRFVDQQNIGKA